MVMESINFPFIVNLIKTFSDEHNIYFLQEYIRGMELFDVIRDMSIRIFLPSLIADLPNNKRFAQQVADTIFYWTTASLLRIPPLQQNHLQRLET